MFSAMTRVCSGSRRACVRIHPVVSRGLYKMHTSVGQFEKSVKVKRNFPLHDSVYTSNTRSQTRIPRVEKPVYELTFEECVNNNLQMTADQEKQVDMYANQQITTFSLKHQYRFGASPAVKNLLSSASFQQKEIPIRFAQRLSFFKDQPFHQHGHPLVQILSRHYLNAFVMSVQGIHEDLEDFTSRMEDVLHFSALLNGVEASRAQKLAAYETLTLSYMHLYDPKKTRLQDLYASNVAGKVGDREVWEFYQNEYAKTALLDSAVFGDKDAQEDECETPGSTTEAVFPQVSSQTKADTYMSHFTVVDEYIDLFQVARLETRLQIAQHVALCEQFINLAELGSEDQTRTLVNAGFVPSLGTSRRVHFDVPLPPTVMQEIGKHNASYYCSSGALRELEGQQTRPVGVAGWVGVIELAMSPLDIVACTVAIGMVEVLDKIIQRGVISEAEYTEKMKKLQLQDPSLPISEDGKLDLTKFQQYFQNQYAMQVEPIVRSLGLAKATEQSVSPFRGDKKAPCTVFNDSWERPIVLKAPEWLKDVIDQQMPEVFISGELQYTCRYPRMHQTYVMVEVMSNAIENTLFSTCIHHCETPQPISVSLAQADGIVTIRVSDYGGGISNENMKHIWAYGTSSRYCEQQMEKVATILDKPIKQHQDKLYDNGFGLPLARVVSRFLLGDLDILSLQDTGLIAYVTIKTMRALDE